MDLDEDEDSSGLPPLLTLSIELGERTPRPARLRGDRNNVLAHFGRALAVLVALLGMCYLFAIAWTRDAGDTFNGYVISHAPVLGIDRVVYKYKCSGGYLTASTFNWDTDVFKPGGGRTDALIHLSGWSTMWPSTVVVTDRDGHPGGSGFVLELFGLGLVCSLGFIPTLLYLPGYLYQKSLVRNGKLSDGFIIRHQPFSRGQRGQALYVWFEYTREGDEAMTNARMRVDMRTYRQLKNRQPVKVFYGKNPSHAIMYECCDFEVIGDDGQAARSAWDKQVMSVRREALPGDLEYRFGKGTIPLRSLRSVKTALVIGLLSAPIWGMAEYSHTPTATCTVSFFGVLYITSFLRTVIVGIVVCYAVLEAGLQWRKRQTDSHWYKEPEDKLTVIDPFDAEAIDDPFKTAVQGDVDTSIWKHE